MKTLFEAVDNVNGDSSLEIWTNGSGDLHIRVFSDEGSESIYLRNGLPLAKELIRELWL